MTDIVHRKYASYDEYLRHQARKLQDRYKQLRKVYHKKVKLFVDELVTTRDTLHWADPALCLAARLGEEVEAFRQIGLPNSVGIDVNPGPDNALVLCGDFHALPFKDRSFGVLYCNSLDHAFDLPRLAVEWRRVLRPGGYLVLGLNVNFDSGAANYLATRGKYESLAWEDPESVLAFFSDFTRAAWHFFPEIRNLRPARTNFVLERPDED